MLINEPVPFREALDREDIKTLLPTALRTRWLQILAPEIRERAFFSATVTKAEFLEKAQSGVRKILEGKANRADMRLQLKQLLQELEYQPATGEAGTLTDLSSDERLNLILDTNVQMARGYGQWAQGQDADILDAFPAQALVRYRIPKGEARDWPGRWEENGGRFFDGRMIALKNDPIWVNISRFDLPYPPFDFNSGMGVEDISRDEAEQLGIIQSGAPAPAPQTRGFNEDLQAAPEVRSQNLIQAVSKALQGIAQFEGGVLKFTGKEAAP